MTLDVEFLDSSNGRTGTKSFDFEDDYPLETVEFLFSEGNYACDCNRSLFLYGDDIYKCSSQLISITKATVRETGRVLCVNDEWKID